MPTNDHIRPAALVLCLLLAGCGRPGERPMMPADSAAVIAAVQAGTWAFHAADTARDAEAVAGLLWPEFTMLADGTRLTYADATAGAREFMATLAVFHTEWTDLEATPLSRDAAITTFRFRDSLVATTGDVTRSVGTTTFVWQRRGDAWRLRYADANHRPVGP